MKLMHPLFDKPLSLSSGTQMTLLIIENKRTYFEFIREVATQSQINEGEFVFSIDGKVHNMSKLVNYIDQFHHFELSRSNVTSLVNYLNLKAQEDYKDEINRISNEVSSLLNAILLNENQAITYSQINIMELMKSSNLEARITHEDVVDSLSDYMSMMSDYCQIELFIVNGVSSYLEQSDLDVLVSFLRYKKIVVLFVENKFANIIWKDVNTVIIDDDMCMIS